MNSVQPPTETDVAHRDLKNILLNGRVLINGLPLTGNELGIIIRGEEMLYAKATQLDKASALVARQKKESKERGEKQTNIIPLKQPEKKE